LQQKYRCRCNIEDREADRDTEDSSSTVSSRTSIIELCKRTVSVIEVVEGITVRDRSDPILLKASSIPWLEQTQKPR